MCMDNQSFSPVYGLISFLGSCPETPFFLLLFLHITHSCLARTVLGMKTTGFNNISIYISIPNDTFSNYLLQSLNFIHYGHVSKTLFKIPHLSSFQKFPSPPRLLGLPFIWHLRVCETQETFDLCYFLSRN